MWDDSLGGNILARSAWSTVFKKPTAMLFLMVCCTEKGSEMLNESREALLGASLHSI